MARAYQNWSDFLKLPEGITQKCVIGEVRDCDMPTITSHFKTGGNTLFLGFRTTLFWGFRTTLFCENKLTCDLVVN